MPGTYSQLYIHIVFTVLGRECLLHRDWRQDVFRYISGIIKNKNQKPIIVNGYSDHVHILLGLNPAQSISDLVRDIKNNSSHFINQKRYLKHKFSWQEGYGAFSYSHSHLKNVYQYIQKQEEHHKRRSFKEEYLDFLNKFEVDYNDKYLFKWID